MREQLDTDINSSNYLRVDMKFTTRNKPIRTAIAGMDERMRHVLPFFSTRLRNNCQGVHRIYRHGIILHMVGL